MVVRRTRGNRCGFCDFCDCCDEAGDGVSLVTVRHGGRKGEHNFVATIISIESPSRTEILSYTNVLKR